MIVTIYGKIGLMEKNYRILLSDAIKHKEKNGTDWFGETAYEKIESEEKLLY